MTYDVQEDIIEKLFDLLSSRYQINLETQMRGSDFIFDCVNSIYHKCHKINFKRSGSYIDSPDWIKKKNTTINPKNCNYKCFQYAVTVALNFDEIKQDPQRVLKTKAFVDNYDQKRINYPSKIEDWYRFEKNNPTITLNDLYIKKSNLSCLYFKSQLKLAL